MSKDKKPSLTIKQESFAVAYIINGGNATQAYRDTYNIAETTTDNVVWVKAHEVRHNGKVSVRIAELQQKKYDGDIMTIEERKKILTVKSRDGDIKSIDMLNRMDGIYIEKKEHTHSIDFENETLKKIQKRLKNDNH